MPTGRSTEAGHRTRLTAPRERVEQILETQAKHGQELAAEADFHSADGGDLWIDWVKRCHRWIALTAEALSSVYSKSGPAIEFRTAATPIENPYLGEREERLAAVTAVEMGVNALHSLKERLDYVESFDPGATAPSAGDRDVDGEIFVVHGHDDSTKTSVARLLEGAGKHHVVILHERDDLGRTLIEKFEAETVAVAYAVVLLTADDLGHARNEEKDARPRARQNVIFELGYFVARIGRRNVAVLHEPGVEIPSDYQGILYIPLDPSGIWRYKLLREMRAVGLGYDLNLVT